MFCWMKTVEHRALTCPSWPIATALCDCCDFTGRGSSMKSWWSGVAPQVALPCGSLPKVTLQWQVRDQQPQPLAASLSEDSSSYFGRIIGLRSQEWQQTFGWSDDIWVTQRQGSVSTLNICLRGPFAADLEKLHSNSLIDTTHWMIASVWLNMTNSHGSTNWSIKHLNPVIIEMLLWSWIIPSPKYHQLEHDVSQLWREYQHISTCINMYTTKYTPTNSWTLWTQLHPPKSRGWSVSELSFLPVPGCQFYPRHPKGTLKAPLRVSSQPVLTPSWSCDHKLPPKNDAFLCWKWLQFGQSLSLTVINMYQPNHLHHHWDAGY